MPKGRHSRLQMEICNAINKVDKEGEIAYAFPELRCTFGNRSVVPDVAVFQWDRIPLNREGEILDDFYLAPDWTIEILSPPQKPNQVMGKILDCLRYDCQLGWFVDPDDRSILIFLPGQQPELKQGNDSLPVLEAIPLDLTADLIFSWLKLGV